MASGLIGVAELTRKLEALKKLDDGKALRSAVRAGIKPAVDRAKATVPIGTVVHRTYKGRLVAPGFARRSMRVITRMSKDKQKATAVLGVRAEAFYVLQFLERGTSKIAKRPWLVPAFEGTLTQQESALAQSLRKSIDKAARSK